MSHPTSAEVFEPDTAVYKIYCPNCDVKWHHVASIAVMESSVQRGVVVCGGCNGRLQVARHQGNLIESAFDVESEKRRQVYEKDIQAGILRPWMKKIRRVFGRE